MVDNDGERARAAAHHGSAALAAMPSGRQVGRRWPGWPKGSETVLRIGCTSAYVATPLQPLARSPDTLPARNTKLTGQLASLEERGAGVVFDAGQRRQRFNNVHALTRGRVGSRQHTLDEACSRRDRPLQAMMPAPLHVDGCPRAVERRLRKWGAEAAARTHLHHAVSSRSHNQVCLIHTRQQLEPIQYARNTHLHHTAHHQVRLVQIRHRLGGDGPRAAIGDLAKRLCREAKETRNAVTRREQCHAAATAAAASQHRHRWHNSPAMATPFHGASQLVLAQLARNMHAVPAHYRHTTNTHIAHP